MNIPDTSDVKDAFGTVIETVVEQHEDIGKLSSSVDKVSEEGKKSRKKIAEITSDKLKQILNYQLKLEEQLQTAQRSIRNFAYNIQGYVDENDEESFIIGDSAAALRNIEVQPGDISGEVVENCAPSLFPTEDGAVPQSDVSFQSNIILKSKKKNVFSPTVVDYHKVPPFVLPSNVKARWRWAIRKTLQMIRRKKLKIGYTRTRVDKSQTVAARLDALDGEFSTLPDFVNSSIRCSKDDILNIMNMNFESVKNDIYAQETKYADKVETQDRRLEALEQVINSLQSQQNGKVQELEEKHLVLESQMNKQFNDLADVIKGMISLNMENFRFSLSSIFDNLSRVEQQSTELLTLLQDRAKSRNESSFDKMLYDHGSIQEYHTQVGVVEGTTNMIQRSLQNVSTEISSTYDHYNQNLTLVSESDLGSLHDLLKMVGKYDEKINDIRESILKMKGLMNDHHSALHKVASDMVTDYLNALSILPMLKEELQGVKSSFSDLKYNLASIDEEKQDMRSEIEDLMHKFEDLERVANEHADVLDQTRNLIERATIASSVETKIELYPSLSQTVECIQPQQLHKAEREENVRIESLATNGDVIQSASIPLSGGPSSGSSRPQSARPSSARVSSGRISSRPQSSKNDKINKFDDSPRDTTAFYTPRHRVASADSVGSLKRDISALRSQLDALKEILLKELMKDRPISDVAGNGDLSATRDVTMDPIFALAFPEDKISDKVISVVKDLLPDYVAQFFHDAPLARPSQQFVATVAKSQATLQSIGSDSVRQTSQQVAGILSSSAQLDTVSVDEMNSTVSANNWGNTHQRPPSAQDLKDSITKAVQKASSNIDGQPVKTREFVRSQSASDSNNKRLIGSFVDYNVSQSLLKTPLSTDLQHNPSNFDSSPLIADIASIRSETLVLQKRLDEIVEEKLNESRTRELVESILREQKRRDSKNDYKVMIEDMDVTVRELVKELLMIKRSNDGNISKLRQDFESALGKALNNHSVIDDSNADAVVSTKALCLGCGRGSNVRMEAASRPTSPSFLPQLSAHSLPGPDIYRAGFKMPVRTSSPPIGTGEIPLLMRGRVESGRSIPDDGIDMAPSIASVQLPQTSKLSHIPTSHDDASVDLKVGFHDDDVGLHSTSTILETPQESGHDKQFGKMSLLLCAIKFSLDNFQNSRGCIVLVEGE